MTNDVPQRVLVTGAAGRLGRVILTLLDSYGVAATGLDQHPAEGTTADRFVVGDVGDPTIVRTALEDVDAVIHCAAIPTPTMDPPEIVFGRNSLATFVVLEEAGRSGIARAVFASSQSIQGLAFSPMPLDPAYLPIDADHPLQVADPYALSKQADEATGVMIARRYGMTVVGLRYPLLGDIDGRLTEYARLYDEDPQHGARPLWAYMDDRDAAVAAWLSLTVELRGYHMFQVAAPDILTSQLTEDLLDRFFPHVPRRRPFPGRTVPLDLQPAADLLGFHATHLYVPEHS